MQKALFLLLLFCLTLNSNKENLKTVHAERVYFHNNDDKILFNRGKSLFIKNCIGCHYIGMDKVATAPALGGITKIRTKDWLYRYTRNSYQMFIDGDSIAVKNREKNWGLMFSFPKLTDSDLEAIYYFIEKNHELPENKKIRRN